MTIGLASQPQYRGLPGRLREDGYDLPPDLPWERWLSIGETLQQMQRSVNWWVGDWLKYGEDRWGQDAYQAVKELTGHGDTAIRNAVWVASKFPPATRVADLSWSHHRAVAELEPDDRQALLQEAATERLPVVEVAKRCRERKEAIRATPDGHVVAASGHPPLTLADLLPDWRQRAEATGAPRAYLQALLDTEQGACFTRWID